MLEIKNLSKKFDQKTILDNVNITLQDGEILSIVGPSGGGKTTLLRCISGLEKMDAGEILIDGEKIDPMSRKMWKIRLVLFSKNSTYFRI